MQKESDFEYFLRKKEENKKIFIYILIGIIIAVVSAAIIVLLFIYFNENEIPNENLTNNETSNENNLPAPTNEINLTNNNLTNPPASSGGGFSPSSSSSPSSTPSPSCTPNKTCSYYYNLNQCGTALSDGCTNSLSCTSCTNGTCSNNTCIQLPSCTSDTDCGNLTGICGTGTCNLTSGSCYINYLAGSICRNSTNECDAVETCISGILSCPADINKTDGEICSLGTCQSGSCTPLSNPVFYSNILSPVDYGDDSSYSASETNGNDGFVVLDES